MGYTLGTPIAMMVPNEDQRPKDYGEMDFYPRPSHADWTYLQKYGVKASSGGGRSSARETIGRVAASAVAEKYLTQTLGIEIVSFVASVGNISMAPVILDDVETSSLRNDWAEWWAFLKSVKRADVDSNDVRCPSPEFAKRMREVDYHNLENRPSTG